MNLGDISHMMGYLPGWHVGYIGAVQHYPAGMGLEPSQDAIQQGSFAGTVGAQQAEHLAGTYVQADLFKHRGGGISKAYVFH